VKLSTNCTAGLEGCARDRDERGSTSWPPMRPWQLRETGRATLLPPIRRDLGRGVSSSRPSLCSIRTPCSSCWHVGQLLERFGAPERGRAVGRRDPGRLRRPRTGEPAWRSRFFQRVRSPNSFEQRRRFRRRADMTRECCSGPSQPAPERRLQVGDQPVSTCIQVHVLHQRLGKTWSWGALARADRFEHRLASEGPLLRIDRATRRA